MILPLKHRVALYLGLFCLLAHRHPFLHDSEVLLESIWFVLYCVRDLILNLFELILGCLAASPATTRRGTTYLSSRSWSRPTLGYLMKPLCDSTSFSVIRCFLGTTFRPRSLGWLFTEVLHEATLFGGGTFHHAWLVKNVCVRSLVEIKNRWTLYPWIIHHWCILPKLPVSSHRL